MLTLGLLNVSWWLLDPKKVLKYKYKLDKICIHENSSTLCWASLKWQQDVGELWYIHSWEMFPSIKCMNRFVALRRGLPPHSWFCRRKCAARQPRSVATEAWGERTMGGRMLRRLWLLIWRTMGWRPSKSWCGRRGSMRCWPWGPGRSITSMWCMMKEVFSFSKNKY